MRRREVIRFNPRLNADLPSGTPDIDQQYHLPCRDAVRVRFRDAVIPSRNYHGVRSKFFLYVCTYVLINLFICL